MSRKSKTFTSQDQKRTNARKTVASVIDYLKASRQALSVHYLSQALGVSINDDYNLKNSLENNDKIELVGKAFRYKPTIDGINNRQDLQRYLDNHTLGVFEKDLEDAYEGCIEDLLDLKTKQRVIAIYNNDKKTNRLFWYPGLTGNNDDNKDDFPLIDESIKLTWRDTNVPTNKEELEKIMNDKNIMSEHATMLGKRKLAAKKPQAKRRKANLAKLNLTNSHMATNLEMLDPNN